MSRTAKIQELFGRSALLRERASTARVPGSKERFLKEAAGAESEAQALLNQPARQAAPRSVKRLRRQRKPRLTRRMKKSFLSRQLKVRKVLRRPGQVTVVLETPQPATDRSRFFNANFQMDRRRLFFT